MSGKKKARRTSFVDRGHVSSKNKTARASTVYHAIENQTINDLDELDGLAPIHRLCAGSSSNCKELIMQCKCGRRPKCTDSEEIHHRTLRVSKGTSQLWKRC